MSAINSSAPAAEPAAAPTFRVARGVFFVLLAVCLLAGFAALLEQAPGLVGPRGVTPVGELLAEWRRGHGDLAPLRAPTPFWLADSDLALRMVALVGLLASASLLIGYRPRLCCVVAWLAWLSFRNLELGGVGWFNYPYDSLQAEVVFLAIALAPSSRWLWRERRDVPRWARWLVLWLLVRLFLGPGVTKLVYHGAWRDLSAVGDFLLTMPHPTPLAATFHDLPAWCIALLSLATLATEIGAPLLLLVPGWPRRAAAFACIGLMVGIQLVCNIRGFNLLTIGLCAFLLDDAWWRGLVPRRWRPVAPAPVSDRPGPWRTAAAAAFVVWIALASIGPVLRTWLVEPARCGSAVAAIEAVTRPLHCVSDYTMFSIVPDVRVGLVVQGSDDGVEWCDYQPFAVPAHVDRAPPVFAPYHDYLSFRLWFAAFSPPAGDAWLRSLQRRLLDGEPEVVRLFAATPFGDRAPAHVRIEWVLWEFASATQRATGTFWTRTPLGTRVAGASRGG